MYWKIQESGLTEIIPLICTSSIWGQYPVFSHLESTYCALSGVAAAVPRWQNLFPSWVTSGLNFRVPAMWWLDDCNILSLLIRQVTFLVHTLFSSVCQSCPALCDPMDCSTPGFPVHHQLPELTQTYVHWVDDAIQPSHPVSSPSPPAFSLSQHQGLLQWVSSSHQVAKILEFHLQHQFFQWRFRTMNILSWIFTPCRSLTLKVEKIRTNLWSCLTKLHISLGIPP